MPFSQVLSEAYVLIKSIFRDKTTLFWIIIFPIILTLIFLGVFAQEEAIHFDVAIRDMDNAQMSQAVMAMLNASGIFTVKLVDKDLEKMVSEGKVAVGLEFPENFTENLMNLKRAYIKIYYIKGESTSEVAGQTLVAMLREFSRNMSDQALSYAVEYVPEQYAGYLEYMMEPIDVKEEVITPQIFAKSSGIKTYFVISIIGIMALYNGIFSGISNVVDRRREGALQILLSSTIKSSTIFIADTLNVLLLMTFSASVIILTGYIMGADYSLISWEHILVAMFLIVVGALSTTGIGLILALLARTSQGAVALGNIVAFPMMFITGLTVPKFMLPQWMQAIGDAFPLSRVIDAVRKMILYNYSIGDTLKYAMIGIATGLTIYIIGALAYRRFLTISVEHPV